MHRHFKDKDSKHARNSLNVINLILGSINPEARVSARDLKDKLCAINLSKFKGNARAILTKIELLFKNILSENGKYDSLIDNMLKVLHAV